jgi:hypothetical protein
MSNVKVILPTGYKPGKVTTRKTDLSKLVQLTGPKSMTVEFALSDDYEARISELITSLNLSQSKVAELQAKLDAILVPAPQPDPIPDPVPVPTPVPTKVESPDRTRGQTIIDSALQEWTFGEGGQGGGYKILADGQWMAGGSAVEFGYVNHTVFVLNSVGQWFIWQGGWRQCGDPFVIVVPDPAMPAEDANDCLRARYSEDDIKAGKCPDVIRRLVPSRSVAEMAAQGWWNLPQQDSADLKWPEEKIIDGEKFVKVNCDGDTSGNHYTTITSWRWTLPEGMQDDIWLTYEFVIDPDVKIGFNELGMKMPGFESQINLWGGFSARTWHGQPNQREKPAIYAPFTTYEYRPDSGDGYGEEPPSSGFVTESVRNTIDFRIKLNTPKDPANVQGTVDGWNHDGVREVWINDKRVMWAGNVMWRINPDARIDFVFYNIYHGGNTGPTATISYWVGPMLVSKKRGGTRRVIEQPVQTPEPTPTPVPTPTPTPIPFITPDWLKGRKAYVPFQIPGTRYDNVLWAGQLAFSGLAKHDDPAKGIARYYSFAVGGHAINGDNSFNQWDYINPSVKKLHPGSNPVGQYMTYPDGLPGSCHTYYLSYVIGNKVYRMFSMAPQPDWPPSTWVDPGKSHMACFDLDKMDYVKFSEGLPNKQWFAGRYTLMVATCCQHPDTQDVYYQNFEDMAILRAAPMQWEDQGSQGNMWGYAGSVIDTKRQLRVCPSADGIHIQDLKTKGYGVIGLTNDPAHALELANGSGAAYDEDNDLYVTGTGSWNFVEGQSRLAVWTTTPDGKVTYRFHLDDPNAGPYGRFDYFRTLKAILYVPANGGETWCIPTVDH